MKSHSKMEIPSNDLIKAIKRYQYCIQQINPAESDPQRVSHYLRKLTKLPIRLQELEQTGIGKTVNALRKADGNIAEEATLLVTKWKANVKKQMEDEEALQQSRSEDAENGDQSDNSAPPSPVQHDGGAAVSPEPMGVAYDDDDGAGADYGSDYGSSAQPRIPARESDDRHCQSASKGRARPVTVQREDSHKRKRSDEDRERSGGSKKERHKRMATDERRRAEAPIPAAKCEPVTVKREPVDGFGDHDDAEAAGDFGERRESDGDQRRRESDKSLKKEHERRHHKSARHEKPSSTTAQREGRHHREDRGHREDRDHREDRHRGQHHEKRQRESADEKHESSRKHRHGEKKSKTRDDREANHSRAEDRKSSKESSKADRKKAASREAESYRGEDVAGDIFGAALLGIPVATSPKKRSTSSKSSNYQDSPPTFSSPKSNQSIDFLSNNLKLEPLSKDLDLYDDQDYLADSHKTPSKYSNSNEHVSPSYYSQSHKTSKPKTLSEEDMFSSMTSMKNRRTKVYHGFKVNSKFPTLFELCVRILQDNFDALEYTGGVPYEVLKPILEKVSVEQLYTFENYNPYLIGETDELWEHHAKKHFRKAERQEYETWRDLYLRCVEEREEKLQSLTENISQSMANSTPVRKTKLAYVDAIVKPPRNVARQQAKHGTGTNIVVKRSPKEPQPSPTAIQSVKERLAKEASSPNAIQIPSKMLKKKAAPLMQKTLQLFKGLKR